MSLLYSIGEVSRITGVTVKALRLYQEKGLIEPARVDDDSGYRYYSQRDVERAHAIRALRDLQFSMDEIRSVLTKLDEGEPLTESLATMRVRLAEELGGAQRALLAVDALLRHEDQARAYLRAPPPIAARDLPEQRIATVRARGQYADASQVFPRLFAAVGPFVVGPPFCLLHEAEYRESDADLSWCLPVLESVKAGAGVSLETLPASRALTVVHTGSWDSVGPSWARLFAHLRTEGRELTPPLRETYLRGPGGPPDSYITELAIGLA